MLFKHRRPTRVVFALWPKWTPEGRVWLEWVLRTDHSDAWWSWTTYRRIPRLSYDRAVALMTAKASTFRKAAPAGPFIFPDKPIMPTKPAVFDDTEFLVPHDTDHVCTWQTLAGTNGLEQICTAPGCDNKRKTPFQPKGLPIRIIFRPVRFQQDPTTAESLLIFVGVTDDEGNNIDASKLEWLADGDHEALVIGRRL